MMRQTLYLILMLNAASIFGQQYNLELIANVESFCGYTSDIWAYVAPDGHEYAAMGVSYGTIIYDLGEPSNPRELLKIDGVESIHRDLKHYKEKIYVVTEGESNAALLVIDMSSAPASISWEYVELYSASYDAQITNCHNLYIDSLGIMYLAGCNVGGGSLIIYDLNSSIPKEISEANTFTNYTHDIFVRDNLAYLSNVYEGEFKIYDIQDLSGPRLLASEFTKATVTHNAWPSDDGNYLFTTDESYRGGVDAYDISNLENVEFLDTYKPISDLRSRPHNTHYYNGYLVTSYYAHGIRIIDAHRPSNLVEVGYFQTGTDRVNADCWRVTPFLPSDLIIGSDINNGLFVLKPTYQRASYLEGFVKSTLDSRGINEVKITILDSYANEEISIFDGSFKTGLVKEGEFQVLFHHPEYYDTSFTINLARAEVTELIAFMRPKEGNPTSVREAIVPDLNIQIFPNPFKTDITIESTENILFGPNLAVHLYDLSGHRIKTYHGIEFNGKLDLKIPDLSSGIYIIKIQQGKLVSKALKVLKL